MSELYSNYGVEVKLTPGITLPAVMETLTRVGITNASHNRLTQTCHILQKRGHYAILHFKELFKLDGNAANIDESDIVRRNIIINMLCEWGMITIAEDIKLQLKTDVACKVNVIKHADKRKWNCIQKYTIKCKGNENG